VEGCYVVGLEDAEGDYHAPIKVVVVSEGGVGWCRGGEGKYHVFMIARKNARTASQATKPPSGGSWAMIPSSGRSSMLVLEEGRVADSVSSCFGWP